MDAVVPLQTRARMRGARGALSWVGLFALIGIWSVTLRPAMLGGPMGYVLVRGTSMLPGYKTGDLVLTRHETSYHTGQIVAYRVPSGQFGAGIVVIHRIVGGSGENGFVLRGDNNPSDDEWHPRTTDIVGHAWLHIPKVGLILSSLRSPLPLASATAAFTVVVLLMVSSKEDQPVLGDEHVVAMRLAIKHGGVHGLRAAAQMLHAVDTRKSA